VSGAEPVALLIEDDPHARAVLQVTLGQHGFHCVQAVTGTAGVAAAEEHQPNVVLLDLALPDIHGVEVTQRIRERSQVPIIVISAHDGETDKIAALDGGANDYLTKPFLPGELMARIRVVLRSSAKVPQVPETGTVTLGELTIDFDRRLVTRWGAEVSLTPIEYRLLGLLVGAQGRVLTHKQILHLVWGARYVAQMNYLRVYMKKLRYKVEREPARPRLLVNVPGVGYRIVAPE
jgi:two-component system, OmpR family, KDP operon response regulator KdpE